MHRITLDKQELLEAISGYLQKKVPAIAGVDCRIAYADLSAAPDIVEVEVAFDRDTPLGQLEAAAIAAANARAMRSRLNG